MFGLVVAAAELDPNVSQCYYQLFSTTVRLYLSFIVTSQASKP